MDTSEEHRQACEVRWISSKDETSRQAYYALVLKHRGKDAANALIAAVNAKRRNRGKSS